MTALAIIFSALVGAQSGDGDVVTDPACAVALAEVKRAAAERGWQAEARCLGLGARQPVEAGSLRVQRVPSDVALRSGLMTLAVHAEDLNHTSARLRITVRVTWVAPAWIATRAVAAGETLQPADATLAPRRWADGVTVQSAWDALAQGRARRSLRAGDVLTSDALLPADAVLRGDRVNVVVASGGIEIRQPAWVLSPARVGERVRVQPLGRNAILQGVLVDAHSVQVEAL